MSAPAGLGRLGEPAFEAAWGTADNASSALAAASIPLGRGFTGGAGAGWNEAEGTGMMQLSSCYVLTGDPIGFMEGLYGPSVTLGAAVSARYDPDAESTDFVLDCGFQFSLFPSFALGVNCSDAAGESVFRTGFSHVFNRSLLVHANYGDETWQGGGELTVKPFLKLLAGTDGDGFNGGMKYTIDRWTFSYGATFRETSIEHCLGLSGRFF